MELKFEKYLKTKPVYALKITPENYYECKKKCDGLGMKDMGSFLANSSVNSKDFYIIDRKTFAETYELAK